MIFKDDEHKLFYIDCLESCQCDIYHKSFFYCIGIDGHVRNHFKEIFDIKNNCILTNCMYASWQTDESQNIIRLAFNLYTNEVPTVCDEIINEKEFLECKKYCVSDVFCSEYAEYFVEAIKLRYPMYMKINLSRCS